MDDFWRHHYPEPPFMETKTNRGHAAEKRVELKATTHSSMRPLRLDY